MTLAPTMLSLVEDYLAERRRLGFDLKIPGMQLLAFARFADRAGHSGPLTFRIVLDWVQGRATRATPLNWARRLGVIRPFAKYRARFDPATEVPDARIFGRLHRRLAPHIHTGREIADLLAAARRLPPSGTLRPATYETLFGSIAATGPRISEALHSRCGDTDPDQGVLVVRQTKFSKSRMAPLHPAVTEALKRYAVQRTRYGCAVTQAPFFVSASGTGLVSRTVHQVFQQLRTDLGWIARGAFAAPRIHDLRHTFICQRVRPWHDQGADIGHAMAALSTYVGHAKISDTYWYLTGVPGPMAIVGERFERFAADVEGKHHG